MNNNFDNGFVKVQIPHITVPKVSFSAPSTTDGFPHFTSSYARRRLQPKPRQHVKDLGDILLGDPFTGTLQLQHTLEDNDSLFTYVPLLNRIAGIYWMSRERFIDPLMQGNIGKAFVNSLETAGSSLDTFANPIKSLMPWAGGGTGEDFLRSMGWLEGEYRKTYQWDTGNFIVDFLGEVVSDPVNWVTWGASAASKNVTKAVKPTARSIMQDIDVYAVKNNKTVSNSMLKVFDQLPQKQQQKILEAVSESIVMGKEDDVLKRLEKLLVDQVATRGDDAGRTFFNNTAKSLWLDETSYLSLQKRILDANNSGLFDSYKTIVKLKDAARAFDSTLTKVSFGLTPIGWSYAGVKYIIKPAYKYVSNSIISKMKDVTPKEMVERGNVVFENIKRDTYVKAEALSDYNKTGMKELLEAHNLTFADVNNMYLDSISAATPYAGTARGYDSLRTYFRHELQSRLDGVYIASHNDPIWNSLKGVKTNKIQRLIQPLDKVGYKDIKVIIPADIYNDLFWEIYSTNVTLLRAQNQIISNNLTIFTDELKKAFTKDAKNTQYLDRAFTNMDEYLNEVYAEQLTQDVHYLNKAFGDLKTLAYKLLDTNSEWAGSYLDKQQFWRLLKEKSPSTTLTTLSEILNLGMKQGASPESLKLYQEYTAKFMALEEFIDKITNKELLRDNLLNTHDTNSHGVILDTIYSFYNGLTRTERVSQYPLRDVLGFIDGGFLKLNNRTYKLTELREFFEDARKLGINVDHQRTILDYYGITFDNAPAISKLYNKRDAEALNKLQLIIEQGKTGRRAYNAQIDNFKNIRMKMNNKFYNTGDAFGTKYIKEQVQETLENLAKNKPTTTNYSNEVEQAVARLVGANEYLHSLQFTNIPSYEMPIFDRLLRSIDIEPHKFDELWTGIMSQDYTNLTADTFTELSAKAQEVRSIIGAVRQAVSIEGSKLPQGIDTFFNELSDTMEYYILPLDTTVADLLDLTDSVYIPMLSREAQTHLHIEKEFASLETKYSRWFNELKKPGSVARQKMETLIQRLENAGQFAPAENLRKLLLNIDNHVSVHRLINMEVTSQYLNYDANTKNLLNSLLYNKLASNQYKNLTARQLRNMAEDIVNDCINDVSRYLDGKIDKLVEDTLKQLEDPVSYIKQHARLNNIPLKIITKEERMSDPILNLMFKDNLGITVKGNIFIKDLDEVSVEEMQSGLIAFSNAAGLDMNEALELIGTKGDAYLSLYFHEYSHAFNKDYKKISEITPNMKGWMIKKEAEARINQIKALRDLSSSGRLISAELDNIKTTYITELLSYSSELEHNEKILGITGAKIYDILDGNVATLTREIGHSRNDVLEALSNITEDTMLYNDYDQVVRILYGEEMLTRKNAVLFGIQHLTKETFATLNSDFANKSVLDAYKESFNYIGLADKMLAGIPENERSIAYATNLITKAEIMQEMNKVGIEANLAEYSMMNKAIAYKKVFDPKVAEQFGIRLGIDVIAKSNSDYLDFYQAFTKAYDRVDKVIGYYDEDALMQLKTNLINTYKHAGVNGAPKDAETYFRLLDINDLQERKILVAWDGLSQDTHLMKSASDVYKPSDAFRNPWRWYEIVENATKDNTIINVDAISDVIKMDPPDYILEELYPRFDYNLESLYKSPDKLKRDPTPFAKYINDDLEVRRYTTDKLKKAKANWSKTVLSSDTCNYLGLPVGTRMHAGTVQEAVKRIQQLDEADTIAMATLPELRTIVDERGGFIIYMAHDGIEPFNFSDEELKSVGLLLHKQAEGIYFLRRTDNIMHHEKINWIRTLPEELNPVVNTMQDILEHSKNYIDLEGTTIPWYYITGDTMDNQFYDWLINAPEFNTFFGDESILKTYTSYGFRDNKNFYTKAYSRPQFTIVGDDGYNRFLDYIKNELGIPINFTRKSNRLDLSMNAGMVDWITRHNSKTKMISLFANDETLLDNEMFHELLDNASDEYLQDIFRKGKYTAAVIKENSQGQIKVHKYFITNHKDLVKAQKIGAHIFPEAVYRNMSLTINKNNLSNKLVMLYRRTIVGAYKSLWLTSPGFLLRNFIDSDIYKNMNEMGGTTSMLEMFQYEYQACKLIDMVNQVHAEVFARTNGKTFNKEILTDVLNHLPARDKELYYLVDTFLSSGASGSLTESMQEFLLQFNKNGSEFAWERALNNIIFDSKLSPTKMIMNVNGKIEQSARLGLFLALIDKEGASIDEAIAKVIRTHFDYTVKNSFEDILEQIFWFATFPINNVLYFVNGGLERNPVMLKAMLDLNELSWNNGEYTYDEIKEKPYLQYHALAGNIRWRSSDGTKDYVLKIGPSLFDFFNIMIDPVGQLRERLNPFIAVATGNAGLSELNPINSHIGRAKQIASGKTLAPSIYTTMNVYDKNYYRRRSNYTRYSSWNKKVYPKRFRKPHSAISNNGYRNARYLSRKYYVHGTRWNNDFMTPITYEPYFDPTSNKYRGAFNRQRRRYLRLPIITPEMRQFTSSNNKREIR